jgi:mannosyltransferase OCH1-like enzyme
MQSWREHNPGHGYVRFDHASAQGFLRARCTPEVLRAYQRAREPAMKADVFRLAYLFAEGGIYADADDRCLRPLAGLLPPQVGFVACQEHFGTLGNNFLAAAPLHPVLGLALELAVQAVNRGDNDMMWLSTGPGLMTRAFAATLAMSALLPAAWLDRTRILALPELEPFVATHCELGYKHSARHWLRATFGQPKAPPAAKPKP